MSDGELAFRPAIDPLTTKNEDLPEREVEKRIKESGAGSGQADNLPNFSLRQVERS